MAEGELWSRLRTSGVHHLDEVALAIVEPSGALTVLRSGRAVDPRILSGVDGADALPGRLFAPPAPRDAV